MNLSTDKYWAQARNMTIKDFKGCDGKIYQVFVKKDLGKPCFLKTKWMTMDNPRNGVAHAG